MAQSRVVAPDPAAEQQTKSERTRAKILDAAATVFSQAGYANARLVDIAELAGMQAGSLYYHFDSREDLVVEILRLGIETAWRRVRDAVDALGPEATPRARLEAAIRAHTLAVLEIGDYTSAQARIVGQVPPEIAKEHRRDQRAYGEYWNGLITGAAEAGVIARDTDLFATRMLAFGAMNWTTEWFEPGHGRSAEDVADAAVRLILNGIASP